MLSKAKFTERYRKAAEMHSLALPPKDVLDEEYADYLYSARVISGEPKLQFRFRASDLSLTWHVRSA